VVKTFKLSFEIDIEILGRKDEGRTMAFQEERKMYTRVQFSRNYLAWLECGV